MSTESFYRNLESFADFQTLGHDSHYQALPDDWFIVISDVRGSTKAIEQGRYQDVNTLGAASVAVLGQLWQHNEVPFVFGGDGASILVPPSKLEEVKRVLMQLRNLAKANYDLELRVGVVPMKDVAAAGFDIEVAKFAVAGTKAIAFMRGGGLSWADSKIKSEPDRYCVSDSDMPALGEIKDLSCRWQPLKSRKGLILTLLARSKANDVLVFAEILEKMSEILGGDVQLSSPVNLENMKHKRIWSSFRTEFKYHAAHLSADYFKRIFWTWFTAWSINGHRRSPFNAVRYTEQIPSHSDFRKFDDMLRLVLDCKPDEVSKIRAYLDTLYRQGFIYYGLHESDHAIMTCLVGSVADGDHIHFIDGGAGGYAMAAKTLKEQLALAHLNGATA